MSLRVASAQRISRQTLRYAISKGGDIYWPETKLRVLANGVVNGVNNAFVDSSVNNYTVTANGDVYQGSDGPFPVGIGGRDSLKNCGSAYFDGSGDYLSVADNSNLEFGAMNFTLEMFVKISANGAIIGRGSPYQSLLLQAVSGSFVLYASSNGSGWDMVNGATMGSYTTNTWHHIALVRNGNNVKLYKDGVGGSNQGFTGTLYDGASQIRVGSDHNNTAFTGWVSNLNLMINTAKYTSDFTKPTAPVLGDTSYTELLLNFNNASIKDETGNTNLKLIGNARISTSASKFGGSSIVFDGTGDWVETEADTDYQVGSGDFTLEYWMYPSGSASADVAANFGGNGYNAHLPYYNGSAWVIYMSSNGSSWDIANGTTLSQNIIGGQWTHFAVSRVGSSIRIFVNGILAATITSSASIYQAVNKLFLGGCSGNDFAGNIDDVRFTKGVGRYTANFTVPATELPVLG